MKPILILSFLFATLLAPLASAQSTPPTISITNRTVQAHGANRYTFNYFFSMDDDIGVTGIEYRGKVNGKPFDAWRSYPAIDETTPFTVQLFCNFFQFQVRAVDAHGNRSAIAESIFSLTPVFKGSRNHKGEVGKAFRYRVQVTNADTFSATGLPKGLKINRNTGVINGTPSKAGAELATITARNAGSSATRALLFRISN